MFNFFGFSGRRAPTAPKVTIPAVRIDMVGREHAGKSVLGDMMYPSLVGKPLPSGLTLGVRDPREVAGLIRRWRTGNGQLSSTGRHTTVNAEVTGLSLLEQGAERARLRLTDSVGQVLTRTPLRATGEKVELYNHYLEGLVAADVLWLVVPCVPRPATSDDVRRMCDDLTLTLSFAQAALRRRDANRPRAAVALVVNRVDVRYESAADVHQRLPEELLRGLRGRFRAVTDMAAVGEAAIFVCSAFGFGTARVLPDKGRRGDGDLQYGEKEWVLQEGCEPRPYNVTALVVWSLLAALRQQPEDHNAETLARVSEMLRQDLDARAGWHEIVKDD